MYRAASGRYADMIYRRVGDSGLKLPAVSLGLWHNFGTDSEESNRKAMIFRAFDLGITHFDIANNYGPLPGSAESNFGKIMKEDLAAYRDELIVSTKAGYDMWEGPYGVKHGSKKYLVASLDASLRRLGLDYVDIFYHHCPDPECRTEEIACALDLIVRQGKALYVGISNYSASQTAEIAAIFEELHTPFIIHQPRYNLFDRWIERELTGVLDRLGKGAICFSPLAQGLLTDRYKDGIPRDSRALNSVFLNEAAVRAAEKRAARLREIAAARGQTLAEMAVAWILRLPVVSSVLVGASRPAQIDENVRALANLSFSAEELAAIDRALAQ